MAHAGICQGVCLAWILLCLYDQPTIIICVFESGTQLREVYTTVSRHCKYAFENGIKKTPVTAVCPLQYLAAHVLTVNVIDTPRVTHDRANWITSRISNMSGIECEANCIRWSLPINRSMSSSLSVIVPMWW